MTPNLRTPLAFRAFVIAIGVVAKLGLPDASDAEVPADCRESPAYTCITDLNEQGRQAVPI